LSVARWFGFLVLKCVNVSVVKPTSARAVPFRSLEVFDRRDGEGLVGT
jgi:hypothetical protein